MSELRAISFLSEADRLITIRHALDYRLKVIIKDNWLTDTRNNSRHPIGLVSFMLAYANEHGAIFTWSMGAHDWNLWHFWISWLKFVTFLDLISILIMQPGHNFAHATTAQLAWHVLNDDLLLPSLFIQEKHVFYYHYYYHYYHYYHYYFSFFFWGGGGGGGLHKPLVKWVPDFHSNMSLLDFPLAFQIIIELSTIAFQFLTIRSILLYVT